MKTNKNFPFFSLLISISIFLSQTTFAAGIPGFKIDAPYDKVYLAVGQETTYTAHVDAPGDGPYQAILYLPEGTQISSFSTLSGNPIRLVDIPSGNLPIAPENTTVFAFTTQGNVNLKLVFKTASSSPTSENISRYSFIKPDGSAFGSPIYTPFAVRQPNRDAGVTYTPQNASIARGQKSTLTFTVPIISSLEGNAFRIQAPQGLQLTRITPKNGIFCSPAFDASTPKTIHDCYIGKDHVLSTITTGQLDVEFQADNSAKPGNTMGKVYILGEVIGKYTPFIPESAFILLVQ